MASRNRGRHKQKLRDLSLEHASLVEQQETERAMKSGDALHAAILGCAMVEQRLESILRSRFKKNDGTTWARLTEDIGPLRSFYAKIWIGYALGIYPSQICDNLQIIRRIRNVFAHSKKLISFDHELIIDELCKISQMKGHKEVCKMIKKSKSGRWSYLILCQCIATDLLKIENSKLRSRLSRLKQKQSLAEWQRLLNPSYRSGDPTAPIPLELRQAILRSLPKDDGI